MQRLRPLSETECYLRCYGWRGQDDAVKVLLPQDVPAPEAPSAVAERVRIALAAMIDSRAPEAA